MHRFDSIVLGSFDIAQTEALKFKHLELTPTHLLYGLILNPQSAASKQMSQHAEVLLQDLGKLASSQTSLSLDQLRLSSSLQEWLAHASRSAVEKSRQEITEADLLAHLKNYFPKLGASWQPVESQNEAPPFLTNLNELALKGKLDPVIGRSKEIRAVMEILGRRSKNNPILVGPAGVGKTAIVEGLAGQIITGEVPDVLKDKIVYTLDMGSLMAGTKYRGEFEERIQTLLKFIKDQAGQAILFIDEIHQLVGAGRTDGAMDAANLLKPSLARGDLHCIGATTLDEFRKYILGDPALERRFRPVMVDEPSTEDAIEILSGIRDRIEMHHGIKISDEALYQAVMLSDQYINDKYLPDKAIDLVDEAASSLKLSAEAMPADLSEMQAEIRSKKIYARFNAQDKSLLEEIEALEKDFSSKKAVWEKEVDSLKKLSSVQNNLERIRFELSVAEREGRFEEASKLKYGVLPEIERELASYQTTWVLRKEHIAQVIYRATGIPVEKILKSKQESLLDLAPYLESQVFGQSEALREIAATLMTSYAGLSDETRPMGSFLLKGPTGVGKTETAKALTKFLFNRESNLVRIDLSEYSEKHSVAKLIGAPAGYVGYDDGGTLTEAVRRKPHAVILFDEVEKAHRDFTDILLQILDDGRLTDNKGRTVSFKNTIIFLTTNSVDIERDFKPELLGRLDGILTYKSLDQSIVGQLVGKLVLQLNERMKAQSISIALDDEVIGFLSDVGYDTTYGARPLQTIFQKKIVRPLADKIIRGEIKDGSTVRFRKPHDASAKDLLIEVSEVPKA